MELGGGLYLHELRSIWALRPENNCVQLTQPLSFMLCWHTSTRLKREHQNKKPAFNFTFMRRLKSMKLKGICLPGLSLRRSAGEIPWAWNSSGIYFCWKCWLETSDTGCLWMTWLLEGIGDTRWGGKGKNVQGALVWQILSDKWAGVDLLLAIYNRTTFFSRTNPWEERSPSRRRQRVCSPVLFPLAHLRRWITSR